MKIKSLTFPLLLVVLFAHSLLSKPASGPSAGLEELFPGTLLDSEGKEVSKAALAGKGFRSGLCKFGLFSQGAIGLYERSGYEMVYPSSPLG